MYLCIMYVCTCARIHIYVCMCVYMCRYMCKYVMHVPYKFVCGSTAKEGLVSNFTLGRSAASINILQLRNTGITVTDT
jgi:hypothetical protein